MCLLVFGLILAVGVQTGYSIFCYDCNSGPIYQGEACEDEFGMPESLLKNCSDINDGRTYTYCRKMTQDVEGEYRVLRMCGSAMEPRFDRCIERTGTKEIKLSYCDCEGDGCNSAQSVILSPLLVCLGVLFTLVAART